MSKATVEQPKASRGRQRPASSAPWVAIDVGYGYTKILTQEGQAHVFPSLVAPAELSNIDLSLSDPQETVKLELQSAATLCRRQLRSTRVPHRDRHSPTYFRLSAGPAPN